MDVPCSARARHLVLGTAGHIDHGKTSLVKALTGIDTDRLKEEQERGISIELGFAHMPLPSGEVVAVVDVPGHERFVRTMVAGAVGIDAVLLVIAADQGVMPQTREHLEICELLGLRGGVVALSKTDRVNAEQLARAQTQVRKALHGTFLLEAPIVPCSAYTGAGLPALRAAIAKVLTALQSRDDAGLFRLPVDRVFALHGFGTVATGTVWSGRLRVGDELTVQSGTFGNARPSAKVRGLHVHGQSVQEAVAGQRAAINLTLPRNALCRGDTLVHNETYSPSEWFEAELSFSKIAREPLKRRSRLLFHAASAQRLCTVTLLNSEQSALPPGGRGLVQIHIDKPLVLVPGDRFILRGFVPQQDHGTTVGGGVVLRTMSGRQRRVSPALLLTLTARAAALCKLRQGQRQSAAETLLRLEVERQELRGADSNWLHKSVPIGQDILQRTLQTLVQTDQLCALGELEDRLYFSLEAQKTVEAAISQMLRLQHQNDPRTAGLSLQTLRSQVHKSQPSLPPRLFQHVLFEMSARGQVVRTQDTVRLRSHQVRADETQRRLEDRITAVYRAAGLAPPRSAELFQLLNVPTHAGKNLRAALDALLRDGTIVRIGEFFFYKPHIAELQKRLVQYLQEHREMTPSAWKELCGQTRKFSIPLAEHFDAERLTLRIGDIRRLR